ncbi:hypothetical protein B0T26DRAFT_815312 [Lasiosphaeria miniovina]|uniref:Protein kinase domain-containing protein n=1 Tax=Lasiosphaeria miniovina TaxID=1954250 RepID=A0AA40DGY5_9PEZI|nr:uncharacterized protein B0T26DRAFT_815312 [Lasiosphaeria miniovina]KAK0703114.1 hypothetical protein B0T26DRAFT_815312 [Lasiosphaeria miniovina]
MSSTPPPSMPSEAALQSVVKNLEDNVFLGNEMQDSESAHVVGKMAADVLDLAHLDALTEWLATFQAVFGAPGLHFRSQSTAATADSPFRASIHLETRGGQAVAGSTRVFGEYRHGSAPAAAEDHGQGDFHRFCLLAQHVFKTQPARLFLHAFLVRGATLELWVFNRSGAYSSGHLDLAQSPHLFVQALAGYAMMSDEECGINTFVKRLGSKPDGHVALDLGGKLHIVVKFSWGVDEIPTELRALKRAGERNVWGVIRLLGHRDLGSIARLRQGLQFPWLFIDQTLSCVFASICELLEVLRDFVKALRSLHLDGGMIHRHIAIKNLVINSQYGDGNPKGVLIDFDQALHLDNRRDVEPLVGSDGFMAIGIFSWGPHTYRHNLESLFYKWCSMDFYAVGQAKTVGISPEGFLGILDEFSPDFAPLRNLAQKLYGLGFPVRDGKIFTGTETEQAALGF